MIRRMIGETFQNVLNLIIPSHTSPNSRAR